ncbi:Mu transposase C-terminal domain-containing protein [Conservatibacter flavescens]|uniref:Transposase n=1 Tax=Conservatibacter flavescens TaxID=28161 RepID=A0A2M8S4W8_9PAST|nr:Mu transposase C-terminal domain-containing protein [Conservatibacter flavescens]PJG86185.1 transposase [Conservatibacter flavescens]
MKEWFSPKEVSGLGGLPSNPSNLTRKATKENWQKRQIQGVRGAAFEYHFTSLPLETQKQLRVKFASQMLANKPKAPLSVERENLDLKACKAKQISIADARMAVASYFLTIEGTEKGKRRALMMQFCDQVKLGELPDELMKMVALGNAKPRKKISLSVRTLYEWVLEYEKAETPTERLKALVPTGLGRKARDWESAAWYRDFLPFYQTMTGVSVTHAYKRFVEAYQGDVPSLSQVRRMMAKTPEIVLQRGRLTGAAYKAKLPFTRREWDVLGLFEVYVGDGHGFKAKVRHPDHAHGFQPEVTAIVDGRTRYVVGWSLAKSESVIAVGDALRHSIERCGLPLVYYSDNGGGEKNKRLDCEVTGLFSRLGITHATGIAGNPQGRGIVERLWKSTLIPLAREYETAVTKSVDKSSAHLIHRKIESAVNAIEKGKELSAEQARFYNKMPRFEVFITDVERVFEEYNRTPHSELPKKADGTHFSPFEYKEWILANEKPQLRWLTEFELELLFRPEEIRTVSRGLVELHTNTYFSTALAEYHGDKVRVGFDIHDPSYVIVKTMDGRWICRAELDGNKRAAFSQSYMEQAREKSVRTANKRLQTKIDRNNKELNPVRTIENQPDFSFVPVQKTAKQAMPIFLTEADKEDWERKQQKAFG